METSVVDMIASKSNAAKSQSVDAEYVHDVRLVADQ